MTTTDPPGRDYYELLNVPRTASSAEIKASYRQLLLSLHPDKFDASKDNPTSTNIDIGQLKDAFVTLSSPGDRLKYDSELSSLLVPVHHHCGADRLTSSRSRISIHLTACSSCSEFIWVGYETCPFEDDGTSHHADGS